MLSQNPDTTGMRDLPPLREPAPPPLPQWRNHQSGPKHIEEVEAYANRLRLYDASKAAYEAELAKRRSPPTIEVNATGQQFMTRDEVEAAIAKATTPRPLNLIVDGETIAGVASAAKPTKAPTFDDITKKLADAWAPQRKPSLPTLDAETAAGCWDFSRAPAWSEADDALAKADPPTSLAEVMRAPAWQGVVVTALPSAQIVSCSLTVTGDTVHVVSPTADVMRALTLACYNTEHNPSIIIDGENPPILAHIVKVSVWRL